MWIPQLMFGEGYWQIDIDLPAQETEKQAKLAANSETNAQFRIVNKKEAIYLVLNGEELIFYDSDVIITEVSEEKKAVMGRPLDCSNDYDRDIVLETLINHDPAYTIEPSDMVKSKKVLVDFLSIYGNGYKPDCIAWGVYRMELK